MTNALNMSTNASFYSLAEGQKPKGKGSIWKGYYEQYGVQHPMVFKKFKAKPGKDLKGKGRDEIGEFTIKGKIHADGGVDFKKEYKGRHTVEYHGKLNGFEIQGEWMVGGATGNFSITVSEQLYKKLIRETID